MKGERERQGEMGGGRGRCSKWGEEREREVAREAGDGAER
jgi:hypothetical protein